MSQPAPPPQPDPRPLSFEVIVIKAIENYNDRTNEPISDYLSSIMMGENQTLDGFRRSIHDQALVLNTQFPTRLDFLINSVVTLVIFISVYFNAYIYESPFQT